MHELISSVQSARFSFSLLAKVRNGPRRMEPTVKNSLRSRILVERILQGCAVLHNAYDRAA